MSPHEGKCYRVGWPCFWTQSTKLSHINYFSIKGLSWELLDKKMAGLHTFLCVCVCGQVCTWHADVHPLMCVQAMGKSVLFIHAAVPPTPPLPRNGGISSVHPCSSPPPRHHYQAGRGLWGSLTPHIKMRNRTLSLGNSLGEVTFPSQLILLSQTIPSPFPYSFRLDLIYSFSPWNRAAFACLAPWDYCRWSYLSGGLQEPDPEFQAAYAYVET